MDKIDNYINGKLCPPVSGNYFDNINPSNGEVYIEIPDSDPNDVEEAVEAASNAFADWSTLPVKDRSDFMLDIADRIDLQLNELAAAESLDNVPATEAIAKWDLNKVIIHHAVGLKKVEEPVVVVGASSAHRDACFEACRYLIDTLKETVPIWKKERFDNKSVWVSAHP